MSPLQEKILVLLKKGKHWKEIAEKLNCAGGGVRKVAAENKIFFSKHRMTTIAKFASKHGIDATMKEFKCTRNAVRVYCCQRDMKPKKIK